MATNQLKHPIYRELRITAIGGGHGLGRLLATLTFMKKRLVGIVATSDNGGSTGRLRADQHCIAWGDIRNCMSQLASQPLAAEVLNFRFEKQTGLEGHSLGNLLLYCLDELSARPVDGIELLSRLLKVASRILPMSETPTDLVAELENELTCFGEFRVDKLNAMPKRLSLFPNVKATPEALLHLTQSDYIILGPGSFLTSVLPPLLVEEIAQTIENSSARVIFVDNLVAEPSPAGQLPLSTRMQWLHRQLGFQPVDAIISAAGDTSTVSYQAERAIAIPVITGAKPDSEIPHRHDETTLLDAIIRTIDTLEEKSQ
ncbi:MAG: uridine diphosphate-N-acetylglucosamine-binding protein YvcK [Aliidiomarina sp.]|uniref:gluconeogenesis factor YvcK family protein n=1 Tax=Aliidiomarina sp. TaxID=1872439 RepID=UPI0025C3BCA0|nr:uridine diphosphate-N-acetylglucosamine-binding protein YvcK [Aliidiomarina sp.]MCH8501810.1 uridine diphosphate-N-acetylglucosamine-binding protein YvcK [Aliidiomarina sp.]